MDDYAGRVLADRYRLPLPPADEYELTETRAFDTYSGQEVLVRQVPLPEVVEAEVLDADGLPEGFTARDRGVRRPDRGRAAGGVRRPADPAVRRAVEAAQAAARIPDHPRLDQVFDVFAEGGSLWIVSELVPARPLAALLAEQPLTPYRAAEVASDVLMALRVLHAHGWVHRNITARTVLVCDDGRVMLTGLAVGAAEEALCGYDPVPSEETEEGDEPGGGGWGGPAGPQGHGGTGGPDRGPGRELERGAPGGPGGFRGVAGSLPGADPEAARRAAIEARAAGGLPGADAGNGTGMPGGAGVPARGTPETGGDIRAARAGAIAAYRAGARAAARVQEGQAGRAALPGARPASDDGHGTAQGQPYEGAPGTPRTPGAPRTPGDATGTPPGQIADPYGVRATPWHGASPRGQGAPGAHGTGRPPALGQAGPNGQAGSNGQAAQGYARQPGERQALPYVPQPQPQPQPYTTGPGTGTPRTGDPAGVHGHPAAPHSRAALPASGDPGFTPAGGPAQPTGRWDEPAAGAPARRGPATALAAERARQARMAVVGPVTERWAPEQAGPVHENWQLAPPIGPATDLWALGALLFRAVQGHAPYPEESTAELVQLVCAEPPAFAEECGPLRPVVESLLRQDPTERLDFEELRGWLRSLVRSAPEPEAGVHVVAAPPVGTGRLPVVRRRGELVRRRRAGLPVHHGRHKRDKERERSPRSLGRTLLLLVLLGLGAAIAYAMLFMPKAESSGGADGAERTGAAGQASQAPAESPGTGSEPTPDQAGPTTGGPSGSGGSTHTQTTGPEVADGFTLRTDEEGFEVAVAEGWQRTPKNGSGQVVYTKGDFELVVVPGRDAADEYGNDPMAYQRESEPELRPYRESSWATATGLKSIRVGERNMAEGQFTWTGEDGTELFVRNLAVLTGGRYHVLQVRGPESERDEVTRLYEQAAATYQVTG
ncbi:MULTISPECIES: protein kinase [unclassified Streptomyces]|uniref:protein kinase n=1 Tax=unclassified Streptomyces TaxID=2593676 RepID=UPI00093E7699|nr:protein kinase [Streptomyces sp. TSRI0107]OKJ87871.1 serine/threonine protein kinase [Streptomyces sp. TSRI0107]